MEIPNFPMSHDCRRYVPTDTTFVNKRHNTVEQWPRGICNTLKDKNQINFYFRSFNTWFFIVEPPCLALKSSQFGSTSIPPPATARSTRGEPKECPLTTQDVPGLLKVAPNEFPSLHLDRPLKKLIPSSYFPTV